MRISVFILNTPVDSWVGFRSCFTLTKRAHGLLPFFQSVATGRLSTSTPQTPPAKKKEKTKPKQYPGTDLQLVKRCRCISLLSPPSSPPSGLLSITVLQQNLTFLLSSACFFFFNLQAAGPVQALKPNI